MALSTRIEVTLGDITTQEVDAIVNAANARLAHGGGVAGAIARAAGPELQRACDELIAERGPLETGEAVATDGFDLPAGKVIHAVGPIYGQHGGEEADLLAAAHRSAIEVASELGVSSRITLVSSRGADREPPRTRIVAADSSASSEA